MSFDHWWLGLYVDAPAYAALRAPFAAAAERAVLSAESRAAIDAWRQRPSDFEQDIATTQERLDQANAFTWAFNLPGFDQLAAEMLTQGGRLTAFGPQEGYAQMTITGRHTPVSILWHVLGYDRAMLLPGRMGNMLLGADAIEAAQAQTRRAYAGTNPDDLLATAHRYASYDAYDDTLREIIDFLPEGLARAKELRRGFLALARAQI
jgi:hypothetical protein